MFAKADKPDETRDQLSVGSREAVEFSSHSLSCNEKKMAIRWEGVAMDIMLNKQQTTRSLFTLQLQFEF